MYILFYYNYMLIHYYSVKAISRYIHAILYELIIGIIDYKL